MFRYVLFVYLKTAARLLTATACSAACVAATYPQWEPLEPGPYAVGFRSVVVWDHSRSYLGNAYDPSLNPSKHRSRPIQISIWYPANPGQEASRMPFYQYLFMTDRERSLDTWSPSQMQALLSDRIESLRAAKIEQAAARAHFEILTAATLNAEPAPGAFPLLAFSPSMLGTPLSNTVMCEFLASHGYVVAAHPSFGAAPGFMTTELQDLELQARDLEYVIGYMEEHGENVDPSKIGVLGHSWGSLAGLIVAARNSKIGAVASLDGSEEMWRDLLDQSPGFDSATFQIPYMRLTHPPSHNSPDYGLFASIQHAPTYHVLLDDSVQHFEFVSSRMLSHRLRGSSSVEEKQRVHALVSSYVLDFFNAFLRGKTGSTRLLEDIAAGKRISEKLVAVEARPRADASLSDSEFLGLLLRDGMEKALRHYQEWVKRDPKVFSEQRLLHLGEQLLWSARHNEEALVILRLAVERFPRSARAYEMIGNVYFWNLGDWQSARKNYQVAFELDPSDLQVKNYLEQLDRLLKDSE